MPSFAHWLRQAAALTARQWCRRQRLCTGSGSTLVPKRSKQRSALWRTPTPTRRAPRRRRTLGTVTRVRRRACASTSPAESRNGLPVQAWTSSLATSLSRASNRHPDRQSPHSFLSRPVRSQPGPELHPTNAATGTKASIQVLRSLMDDNGVQVLGPTETGDPSGTAWTEAGEIDHRGHDVGIRLVDYLDEEVDRIVAAFASCSMPVGKRVEVVTDHGWILLPGGMEKVELPPATTEVKKGRCARLKDGADVDVPTVPWFWDPDVRIALAPGATCFEANKEYEHGGVSPQECIVPRLTVTAGLRQRDHARSRVHEGEVAGACSAESEFSGVTDKVVVDLRGLPAEPKSSIAEQAKETSSAGRCLLLVSDEEHEGERAHLVLVAPDGQILAQREVVVGRNR